MMDPVALASMASVAAGSAFAAHDYMRRRMLSAEDRYMHLYAKDEWEASDMDLSIHFDPSLDAEVKSTFLERVQTHIDGGDTPFHEVLCEESEKLAFRAEENLRVRDLLEKRRGIYFDLATPGRIRVIWNHMQFDGVAMWASLKPLFDENPPLVTYSGAKTPVPFLPELLSLPGTTRRLLWRGTLRPKSKKLLSSGLAVWSTEEARQIRQDHSLPFNLVTSAMVVDKVFKAHPEAAQLTVGLTLYFPFLESRNRYGLLLCRIKRGDVLSIVRQMQKQTKHPLVVWGVSAAQSYALNRIPEKLLVPVMDYYRRQIDVLISNLPVGKLPTSMGGRRVTVSCHQVETSLAYYFLVVGTREQLHISYTSRFDRDDRFLKCASSRPVVPLANAADQQN